jgi:hypothetical protein
MQPSWAPRINITKSVTVVPTISTSAYSTGYQIGGIQELTDVVRQDPSGLGAGVAEIHSVSIIDGNKQDQPIDIWFFSTSPTLTNAGDRTAFSISAANAKAAHAKCISIGQSYSDSAVASASTDGRNVGLVISVPYTSATPKSIFAVAVIRGSATFSALGLQFEYDFYVD